MIMLFHWFGTHTWHIIRAGKAPTKSGLMQSGIGLVETLVAVAILGTAVTAFVVALNTGLLGVGAQDEGRIAQQLAQTQLEYTKSVAYVSGAVTYPAVTTPPGYDIEVNVSALDPPADSDIQRITVIVSRDGEDILSVDGYKVNR